MTDTSTTNDRLSVLDMAVKLAANGRISANAVLDKAKLYASFVETGEATDPKVNEDKIERAQELGNIATGALRRGDVYGFGDAMDTLTDEADGMSLNEENQMWGAFLTEIRENISPDLDHQ